MNTAPPTPDEFIPIPVAATTDISPPAAEEPVVDAARLMPYETVAKAIFVKANGLEAYDRATRFVRRTD